MKRFLPLIILVLVVLGGVLLSNFSQTNQTQKQVEGKNGQISFQNPKKSAHYETNTPLHGAILAGVPINIVIDFNFDLGKKSTISIKNNDQEYGVGETIIDEDKLTMRRNVDLGAPEGIYTVNYSACWPDNSCHDGHFQFAIERTKALNFTDLRNKQSLPSSDDKREQSSSVKVSLRESKFAPQKIRISRGTKVTWVNDDLIEHYVNTDSHPAHTYYQDQNSKVLRRGEEYSLTFDKIGEYPYHCSAHAGSMIGSILVE